MGYTRFDLDSFIASIPLYPNGAFLGQGIVISSGGPYLPSTYIGIRSLREVGCSLPIQVWYLGNREFPPIVQDIFKPFNVTFIDATSITPIIPFKTLGGWQNKVFSIVNSSFEEVILFVPQHDNEIM